MYILNTTVRIKKVNKIVNNKSPFRKKEYEKWDGPAKKAVRNYLISLGCVLAEDIEDYGADIVTREPLESYHEVEVKNGWTDEWPSHWKTLHIPFRKKRLIDMMKDKDDLTFYVLRKDLKQAWKIKGSQLTDDIVVEVPNKFKRKGEYFFNISVNNVRLITL
jgi:hypothetical protein